MKIIIGKDNSILRQKNRNVRAVTSEIKELIARMFFIMQKANGIGIAAPQVGKNIKLFLVDKLAFDPKRSKWEFKKIPPPDVSRGFAFLNSSISSYPKERDEMMEGCLSLPGWEGVVRRAKRITIKAQDIEGRVFKLQAKGLLARVLQHEYDHLQRTLVCDKWENERKVKSQNEFHHSFGMTKVKIITQKSKLNGIVFFGDSEYSKIVLKKLQNTPYESEIVITKNSKAFHHSSLRNVSILNSKFSLGITAAYGAIIPQNIIEKFKYGILNIHPSLLPKYRGPSPLQETIISGDKTAGVSIIQLTSRMDAGPILAQKEFSLYKPYTSGELGTILFEIGAELLKTILSSYIKGVSVPTLQDERAASYTSLIKKEDALIDWSEDALRIERKIRAYQPWPVAYTFFSHRGKKMRLQILEADVVEDNGEHGIIGKKNNKMIVYCGKGSLLIKKLRPEGKHEMSGEEFLRGYQATVFFSQTKEA